MPRLSLVLPDGSVSLPLLRQVYQEAVAKSGQADYLLGLLQKADTKSAAVLAYEGALQTLKARDLWNPLEKLHWAKQSQVTLAQAIALQPTHIEPRFLRYSIQLGLPAYLQLHTHLADDQAAIVEGLKTGQTQDLTAQGVRTIAAFMLANARLSPSDRRALQAFA